MQLSRLKSSRGLQSERSQHQELWPQVALSLTDSWNSIPQGAVPGQNGCLAGNWGQGYLWQWFTCCQNLKQGWWLRFSSFHVLIISLMRVSLTWTSMLQEITSILKELTRVQRQLESKSTWIIINHIVKYCQHNKWSDKNYHYLFNYLFLFFSHQHSCGAQRSVSRLQGSSGLLLIWGPTLKTPGLTRFQNGPLCLKARGRPPARREHQESSGDARWCQRGISGVTHGLHQV